MEKITALDVQRAWAHNEPDHFPTLRELDEQVQRDVDRQDRRHLALCVHHRRQTPRLARRNPKTAA